MQGVRTADGSLRQRVKAGESAPREVRVRGDGGLVASHVYGPGLTDPFGVVLGEAAAVAPQGVVRPDGVGELDVRVTVQAEDGALIYVTYRGYLTKVFELIPRWAAGEQIPREEYYFVITPYFETSAAQYAWLQQVVAIGMGTLIPGGVKYRVFAVR